MAINIVRRILHPFHYREQQIVDRILAQHAREQVRAEQIAEQYGPPPIVSGQVTSVVGGQVTARYDPETDTSFYYDPATGRRVDSKYGLFNRSGERELDRERQSLPSDRVSDTVYDQASNNVLDEVRRQEAADAREAAEPHRYSEGS